MGTEGLGKYLPPKKHLWVKPGEPQPVQPAGSQRLVSAHSRRPGDPASPSRFVLTQVGNTTGLSSGTS